MKLGDGVVNPIESIPTGALSLDYALGIGGIPRGRVTEVYGPESSGKTTLCLHIIAEAQKAGGLAAFIDAEHALDVNYAKRLGVDTPNLLLSQPDFGEQALEITDTLVRSNALDIIVIDSVAALVPRSEIEGEMGDATMAVQARLMSQALRKLTGAISKSKTAVVFINQLRSKIGVMFGNPETTTGGNALKFYASLRMDIRRIAAIKEGNECFAVIFGDVGLGKTLSLRVIIDSLEPERYKVALITNPALSFVQLLKEIIGQITGKQCEIKKGLYLHITPNRGLESTLTNNLTNGDRFC